VYPQGRVVHTGVENAGVENEGADRVDGKCSSNNAWKSVKRENYKIPVV